MNLFDNKKDIIHRLINLVLVLWAVGALFFVSFNLINLLVKEPVLNYDEYKEARCYKYERAKDLTADQLLEQDTYCEQQYAGYKVDLKNSTYNNTKGLLIASGNFAIVGTFIYLLNKKRTK